MSLDVRFGKRRTVNMNEEIAQELNRIANLQGKTLYSLINEIGLSAIEADKGGFSLVEAINAKRLLERARRSRMVLVNQDLWYLGSSRAWKAAKTKWMKEVYATYRWQANVFLSGSTDKEFIESLKAFVHDFFWDCADARFEERRGGELDMRLAFVPEMSLDHTRVLFKAFEGMMNVHGYLATESSVVSGFLTATFRRVNPSPLAVPSSPVD